jgi:hypothetical protein
MCALVQDVNTDTWGELFERARSFETDETAVRETLAARRTGEGDGDGDGHGDASEHGCEGEGEGEGEDEGEDA